MSTGAALAGTGARMAALSALSFVANVGLFAGLHRGLGVPANLAAAIAMGAVLALNFAACRYFVFRAAAGSLRSQALRFVGGTLVFRSLEWLTFSAAASLTAWNTLLLYPATLAFFFVVKLLVYGRFVFDDRR